MYFAAFQFFQLLHSQLRLFICCGTNAQGDEDFICVQSGVMVAQMRHFQMLDRFDDGGRNQLHIVIQICQFLQYVQQHSRRRAQQRACLAGNDGTVRQFDGCRGSC